MSIQIEFVPDKYTFQKSAIVLLWIRQEDGSYVCDQDDSGNYYYNTIIGTNDWNNIVIGNSRNGSTEAVKWYDSTYIPQKVSFTIPTGTLLGQIIPSDRIVGKFVTYIVETLPTKAEISTLIDALSSNYSMNAPARLLSQSQPEQSFIFSIEQPIATDKQTEIDKVSTEKLTIDTTVSDMATFHAVSPIELTIVDPLGRIIANVSINGDHTIELPAGVYFANNKKFMVR